jgi:hypothetical protein
MNWLPKAVPSRKRGAALIIVLAFVVLLTGLTIAYFSRATSDRQVAHSSFNQSNVDQLAQSAMDNIIGDLRKEILNGSGSPSPTASPVSLFVPTSNANILPMRSPTATPGTTPAIPNLIRRSARSDPTLWPDLTVGPALGSRASAVNSTGDVSANGRSVTLARWNSHYLIPKSNTTDGGSDPITTGFTGPNYWAPDWVFVTSAGATPAPAPANVLGRYAYVIYDEGGLLDMNAAGYPSPTTILQYGRKGSLAFADLTGLGSYGLSTIASDNVVGWRNYASSQPSGTLSSNFTFSANATNTYYNFILSDPNYIQLTNYFTNSFLTTSQAPVNNNRTDQAMTARQELIKIRSAVSAGISFSNALQYLGTFSREAAAGTPQWSPVAPDSINPNFQNLVVTSPFTRNDGTTAAVGDYLVNKRFLLQRLNWLTYKGPSGPSAANPTGRNIPISAPALGSTDYDMWLLTRTDGITFGLTGNFLLQGTDANILKYFGLAWDATNQRWNYVGTSGNPLPISSIATFGVGGTQAATREPDFFELLQAGIFNNSLGDATSSDPALPLVHQQSKVLHILTIGANLIAQSRADSYPVRISCSVGGTIMEAVGMPRLPCLSSLAACAVAGSSGANGGVNWFLIPNLWDPFRDTWDLTEANTGNTGNKPLSTPGYLRPLVRITVKGSAMLGGAAASQSGSVDPTSVTTLSGTSTGNINASLTLQTGTTTNNAFGRDGLREAMRLGTADINDNTLTAFNPPTQSSTGSSWNSITKPTNDPAAYRNDNFVVFRVSIPGSSIPSGRNGQKPVLILQSGFQVEMDYQSPNGQWYPYSFLQGNNASNTWITANPLPGLSLATTFSQYGINGGKEMIVDSGTSNPTSWTMASLAPAPMFARADPRSIRYNSQIGVVNLANPPLSFTSAGIIASIWPSPYATPPPMTPSAFPIPTPAGSPNPAAYSQVGDNGPAGSNPYSEAAPASETDFTHNDPVRPVMMNRPFRSVGEMGYAFRDQPFRTLSFSSASSPDAGLLDLFSANTYSDSSGMRGGVVSLNSRQAPALAGVLTSTIRREDTPRNNAGTSPSPSPLASPTANSVATSLTLSTLTAPVVNRAGLATLIASETGLGTSVPKTQRESIARALGEADQTRTWNLLIDVIAQSGKYAPGETDLKKFVVEGEQRYWVHVAIDRFTGKVIDKQIEVINE